MRRRVCAEGGSGGVREGEEKDIGFEQKEGVTEPWRPAILTNNVNNLNNRTSQINNRNVRNSSSSELSEMSSCKDSLCTMDYLLDPRKSVSIEQLAAYVSS